MENKTWTYSPQVLRRTEHRFDVEAETGRALLDYMYKLPDGIARTAPAGTKVAWPADAVGTVS